MVPVAIFPKLQLFANGIQLIESKNKNGNLGFMKEKLQLLHTNYALSNELNVGNIMFQWVLSM